MRETLVVVAAYGEGRLAYWRDYPGPLQIVRTDMPAHLPEGQIATPYQGFDTGAYLWAYWHCPAQKYLFVQDSLVPNVKDFAEPFFSVMPPWDVVAWTGFPFPSWDSLGQQVYAQYSYPEVTPPLGIFGPIFAAARGALDTLARERLLPGIPQHKEAAQAKEREWPMAFQKAGIYTHFLHTRFDTGLMQRGHHPPFTKRWEGRE